MSPLLNPDADAGVFDFHTQLFGQNVVFKPHVDAALQRELDRVAEQVGRDLPQAHRVGEHAPRNLRGHLAGELETLALGARPQQVRDLGEQGVQAGLDHVEGQLAGFDARDVENVVDQREQGGGSVARARQAFVLLAGELPLGLHDLGHAEDDVHRRADLVANVGEELRLGPRRVARPVARALEAPVEQ